VCSKAIAQFDNHHNQHQDNDYTGTFGYGIGLDYGGIGIRLGTLPEKHFELFGALGYNLNSIGVNFGTTIKLLPDSRVTPTILGMYGYNAAIVVKGASQYNKTYYGPSFGTGLQVSLGSGRNFLNFELLFPIRPQKFHDDITKLKNNSRISNITEPPPFGIAIGYHIRF
jgi:hypothetical protein